ncbi:hypothetical protein [Azospirillum sp. B4]|uniref:hypothetical protein n=1 Tax=Azospirillum sp. B4 TaxID=95605 RepID=UPI00034D6444|nr:hypothetical protein [Azospirillum sp. B4]
MNPIIILKNGTPWLVAQPTDQADLDRFLLAANSNPAETHTTAPASPAQAAKIAAARIIHGLAGRDPDMLFGVEL